MTKQNLIEVTFGSVVLFLAIWFGVRLMQSSHSSNTLHNTYMVKAFFPSVDGLQTDAKVTVSGVPIGRVEAIKLDNKTLLAEVHLRLTKDFALPEDSNASVASKSIMGGKLITLTPGHSQTLLKDGDVIERTQGALNLERMVSQFVFGMKR